MAVQTLTNPLLALGSLSPGHLAALRNAAAESALELKHVVSSHDALAWLEQHAACALAIDLGHANARAFCADLRADATRPPLPIFGLADPVTDLTFAEFFGWGGDEVVCLSALDDLIPRLRGIRELRPAAMRSDARGRAVLADVDPLRRALAARVLHGAGYEVEFAANADELQAVLAAKPATLIVCDLGLPPQGALDLLQKLRAQGNEVPWILAAAPRAFRDTQEAVVNWEKIALYDVFTPPDNILFLANELARDPHREGRTKPRVLYGTRVALRRAGAEKDTLGYTYNVSETGLFVRTLLPLTAGEELWLELVPPRTDRRVRLEAQVMWRRSFGPIGGATCPAGVGLHLSGGSHNDRERYVQGCRELASGLGMLKK